MHRVLARCTPPSIAAVGVLTVLLAGCGSSKPGYCSKVSDLKKSIQSLGDVNVVKNGTASLKTALQTVQTNANAAIDAAKSDFPDETKALKVSLDALGSSVQQVSSAPTPAGLATVASDVASGVNAAKKFADSASSKCG